MPSSVLLERKDRDVVRDHHRKVLSKKLVFTREMNDLLMPRASRDRKGIMYCIREENAYLDSDMRFVCER